MLKIAVPNKGTLSETTVDMLREAGYAVRRDPKELIVADPRNDAEFFYLRPRDIATYVGSGALDIGVTGRDLLLDSGSAATEVQELDFGASTFRFAGPIGRFETLADLEGARIATSYTGLVGDFLRREGVTVDLRMTGPKISRPCRRSVVPVSTTSATASATPSRTADSTAPSSRMRSTVTPSRRRKSPTSPV
jgi:ATP phosphoribosyltransferase